MYLSELRIENFRSFGEGENSFTLKLQPGLTALVGENDAGKSAVIDALRFALSTRDQEYMRVEESDFHQPPGTSGRRNSIVVQCKFENLKGSEQAAFLEYLTYEGEETQKRPVLYVNWRASVVARKGRRRFTPTETLCGVNADGPQFDYEAKSLLASTYMRPLRDAEKELSAGRNSRLSQILQFTREVVEHGIPWDEKDGHPEDVSQLNILAIGDYTNSLLRKHSGIKKASSRLNSDYLKKLSFAGDELRGDVSVSGSKEESTRLRQLLEKLELELRDEGAGEPPPRRGMGSNNLLFMACELLLLGTEKDGLPLLLIEEPEAHLHPQRQLLLMKFLQEQAFDQENPIQVIVTTHSPNLASAIDVENLVMIHNSKAYPLSENETKLDTSDYGFLKRFLDVSKANMFFARGVVIVEGDAENILLPTLARLLGRDFTTHGVSIVNVGGVGLRRFARVYQRKSPKDQGMLKIPVACITDLDVMPDCAPEIVGKVEPGTNWPIKSKRKWRAEKDFEEGELEQKRDEIDAKASGQKVKTFIADSWTLEYDLARGEIGKAVWVAAHLAIADEKLCDGSKTCRDVLESALRNWKEKKFDEMNAEVRASHIYSCFTKGTKASKAIAAQYLASIIESRVKKKKWTVGQLKAALPSYLLEVIEYVTRNESEPVTVASERDTE